MGRFLLTDSASEHLIAFLRDREDVLRKLGFRIVENGNPARAGEVYVGSRVELESSLIGNTSIPSIAHMSLEPSISEDREFLDLLSRLRPFITYQYTPYGNVWLKAEKVEGHVHLTCPFCGEELDCVFSHSGDIFPDTCKCGVCIAIDVTDGSFFSVLEVADFGVRNERVRAGLVEYAAIVLKDIPEDLKKQLIEVLYSPAEEAVINTTHITNESFTASGPEDEPSMPYPDDTLYDGIIYFSADRPKAKDARGKPKPKDHELCAVFYRKSSDKETLLIAESASPLVARKIRGVFHRLKESYSILVNGEEVKEPSQIVPGATIEIASELFVPHGDRVIIPVQYGRMSSKDPVFLLDPLLNIDTTREGYIILERAKIHEVTLKCPFCGEEETYIFSCDSEEAYPSACNCGAAVSATNFPPLPETTEEGFMKALNRLFDKIERGEMFTSTDMSTFFQLRNGYIVERKTADGKEWVKVKKLTEKVRNLPVPCFSSMEVSATIWLVNMDCCWVSFEKEDIEFVSS